MLYKYSHAASTYSMFKYNFKIILNIVEKE